MPVVWAGVLTGGAAMSEGGGIHWELDEALKLIEQGRAAGDWGAERLGWVRLTEALVNAASSGSAAQIAPVLKQAYEERKEDAANTAHLVRLLLDQTEKEQGELGRQAARIGLIETAEHEHIPPWLLRRMLRHLAQSILQLMERERILEGQVAEDEVDAADTRDLIHDLYRHVEEPLTAEERTAGLEEPDPPAWIYPNNEGETRE